MVLLPDKILTPLTPPPQLIIEAKNISVHLHGIDVLKGIDLFVKAGESVAIVGHNGAGKTSLMRCILGMLPGTVGSVKLWGRTLGKRDTYFMRRIGVMLDRPVFYERITVEHHLRLVQMLRCQRSQSLPDRLHEWWDLLGLQAHLSKRIKDCSVGVRRQVAIGAALIGDPELVLMDDPAAELNSEGVDAFIVLMKQRLVATGCTLLLATHSLSLARALCNRIVLLEDGTIVFAGTWEEYDTVVGGIYEITLSSGIGNLCNELSNYPEVLSVQRASDSTIMVRICPNDVPNLVTWLVSHNYNVASVVPVSVCVTKLGADLHESIQTLHLLPRASFAQPCLEKASHAGTNDTQTSGSFPNAQGNGYPEAPDYADSLETCSAPPRSRHTSNSLEIVPSGVRQILSMLVWHGRDFTCSSVMWTFPMIVLVLSVLGVLASVFIQRMLLQSELTFVQLLSNVISGLIVAGLFAVTIAAGVSAAKDFRERRLRWLFLLPLRNSIIVVTRIIVWNGGLSIFSACSFMAVGVPVCVLSTLLLGYNWSAPGLPTSPDILLREIVSISPFVIISYWGSGLLGTALGAMIRRTIPTVVATVFLYTIGLITFLGVPGYCLPFVDMISGSTQRIQAIANGMLVISSFPQCHDIIMSLAASCILFLASLVASCTKTHPWKTDDEIATM